MTSLTTSLHRLEDLIDPALIAEYDAPVADMDVATFSWLQRAVERSRQHPHMKDLETNTAIAVGDCSHVKVIICSPEILENMFGLDPHALGCCNLDVPDCDPFNENSAFARDYRVLIGWDPEVVRGHILDSDPENPENAAMAWLATLTHELHHVRLFAENGSMNAPADLDTMAEDIGHDIFDIASGYGIRPLELWGGEVWAEDCFEAADQMEEYVEDRGRIMAETLFTGDLSPASFLETSGILEIPEGKNMKQQNITPHPEDRLDWPDGTSADRADYDNGDYHFMSDDFTVTPSSQRLDHLGDAPSDRELAEGLIGIMKDLGRNAVVHFDNDEICLEMTVMEEGFAPEVENALKRVATSIIQAQCPDVSTGIRAFGDISFDGFSGITFGGWQVGDSINEAITDEDGRWIPLTDLNGPDEKAPSP